MHAHAELLFISSDIKQNDSLRAILTLHVMHSDNMVAEEKATFSICFGSQERHDTTKRFACSLFPLFVPLIAL